MLQLIKVTDAGRRTQATKAFSPEAALREDVTSPKLARFSAFSAEVHA